LGGKSWGSKRVGREPKRHLPAHEIAPPVARGGAAGHSGLYESFDAGSAGTLGSYEFVICRVWTWRVSGWR